MAHGLKESDFQNGIVIPYLTMHEPDGLNWILGKPSDIDASRWLVLQDLLDFLRDGSSLNRSAFEKASRGYASDDEFVLAFVHEALIPRIEAVSYTHLTLPTKA